MFPQISITNDLEYLALFSLVLLFPKILMRFNIPSGITALVIGVAASQLDPNLSDDKLFRFLSQIGITSLFVFALLLFVLQLDGAELADDHRSRSAHCAGR